MFTLLTMLSILFFVIICILRIDLAYVIFLFLLPTYLIRYDFFGVPTTYLELIFVPLALMSFVILRHEIKQRILEHIHNQKFILIGIILLFLGAVIGVFYSPDIRPALGHLRAFFIEPIIFYILILSAWSKFPKLKNLTIYSLLLAALITAILAIFQHFTGWMVPWDFWQNRNTYRVTGFWGYPNGVGLFIAPLALLTFSIFQNNSKKYFFYTIVLIISTLACLYAKSTGALIAITSGVLIFCLSFKKLRLPLLIGVAIAGLFILLSPQTKSIRDEMLLNDYSGSLRLNIWGETTALLSNHPIIGSGLAGYKTMIRPYRIDKWVEVFEHPHNLWLSIWVNAGLTGFLGLTLITLSVLNSIWQALKKNNQTMTAACTPMIAIFVFGLVDTPYLKNDSVFIFIFALALITSLCLDMKNKTTG